jgi:hypothetical protein
LNLLNVSLPFWRVLVVFGKMFRTIEKKSCFLTDKNNGRHFTKTLKIDETAGPGR